ncbi:hypothetical protein CALCODRAFT_507260 [Calocera cornea HHB12733]|uniref:Uncharacterized protein n=1 Tax=Calocera cornea HHB12733 TaxID=1353952 RepID=A0A165HYH3_9BASI|nr:hypothetical protein CALCODRAFT_507260 [Calocera cornea HHB12733]
MTTVLSALFQSATGKIERDAVYEAVFYALVGATSLEHGVPAMWNELVELLKEWFRRLHERPFKTMPSFPAFGSDLITGMVLVISDGNDRWRRVSSEHHTCLAQFREYADQMNLMVTWRESSLAGYWVLYLLLEGDEVAAAIGRSKQTAKHAAARAALGDVDWALAISRSLHRFTTAQDATADQRPDEERMWPRD